MTTPVGTTIGSIRIEQSLSTGGSGSLLLGRQPALERLVAVRKLPGELLEHPAVTERFRREARLGARIHHPNIVAVLDCFAYRGDHYLVLEYVDGPDLREILTRGGRAPTQVAVSIGLELARGLQELHSRGIVHINLTPERILLSRWGEPKIRGLGLARERNEDSPPQGMPGPYTAPEVAAGAMGDARADVYTLGALLYELLTERPPDEGKIRTRGVPKPLARLVARCLQRDPQRRPQTADAVRRALEPLADSPEPPACRGAILDWLYKGGVLRPAQAARVEELATETEEPLEEARSFPLAWAVAGAAVAVVGLAFLLQTLSPRESTAPPAPQEASSERVPPAVSSMAPPLTPPAVASGVPAPEPEPARVRFVVHPWAQVELDGGPTFLTPRAEPMEIAPGDHVVIFRHPRLGTHRLDIQVKAGEERVIRHVLPDGPTG
jgi:hypothetical protein